MALRSRHAIPKNRTDRHQRWPFRDRDSNATTEIARDIGRQAHPRAIAAPPATSVAGGDSTASSCPFGGPKPVIAPVLADLRTADAMRVSQALLRVASPARVPIHFLRIASSVFTSGLVPAWSSDRRFERFHARCRRHGPLLIAAVVIALWVLVPAWRSPGQWGDNFEQFVWAHGFEWGYYKHPPLPTWLMEALILIAGPSRYWAELLAGLCNVGTAFFTHRIAQRLLGARLAGLALLFWGLQQAFSARAQLYNHNTVLMLMISATAWCVLQAVAGRDLRRWWIAAGLGAGAAMLSKYQALVPLGGIVLALQLTGDLRSADIRRGLALAIGVALVVLTPHVAWMVRHDFTTLHYAAQEGRPLDWLGRAQSVASFLAQQLRLLLPALAFSLLLATLPGLQRHESGPHHSALEVVHWRRAWFIGLVGFPLVATVLTAPVLGLRLQNHWGFQCLQFVALWAASRLRNASRRPAAFIIALALALQGASLAVIAGPFGPKPNEVVRRDDLDYPAQRLASAVVHDWSEMTSCPLKLVVGPAFEGGMISVYSGGSAAVLEGGDFAKSPWVTPEALTRDGAVYVADALEHLPARAVLIDSMALGVQTWSPNGSDRIYWAVVPPHRCKP